MLTSVSSHPGITFAVDPVEPATEPLEELEAAEIHQQLRLGLEACATLEEGHLLSLFGDGCSHAFMETIHLAYAGHRPLILSPDHIWLILLQGLNYHVQENAEALRSLFVSHESKETLEVQRDDFIKGSPHNAWPEVAAQFASQIRSKARNSAFVDTLIKPYSTTGLNEQMAFHTTVMSVFKNYFDYLVSTLCGIPSVTLEGTLEDWQDLRQRIEGFAEFHLDEWVRMLRPILDQLVQTAAGHPNTDFWRSIYKDPELGSGGPYINGWVVRLFPYLSEMGRLVPNTHWRWPPSDHQSVITWRNLPSQLIVQPFIWNVMGQKFNMEFVSGFIGIRQYPDTLALRPEISWVVRDQDAWESDLEVVFERSKTNPDEKSAILGLEMHRVMKFLSDKSLKRKP